MKIYKEGNFYHYNSPNYIGTVHESGLGMEQVANDTKIRLSLDTVGLRGEANIQEDFLYADVKNLAGSAHGATYLAIITGILT